MEPNHPLFALIRASLWGSPFSPDPEPDYKEIWQELKMHAIQNLSAEILTQVDPDNTPRYLRSAAKSCAHWLELMEVQKTVCLELENAGIPCAVLKGAAACVYYTHPSCRCMGDLDLIVSQTDHDRAVKTLLAAGCILTDDRNPRHTELQKDNIHIEIHRHFAVLSEKSRAERADGMLAAALPRRKKVELEGFPFFILPEKENGLALLEHINSHMVTGLGLRQIIDWMLYVHHCLDDQAWNDGAEDMFASVGLKKLAVTVTRMCQLYLGLRTDITWCLATDDMLCHRLMEHIFRQGNFGRKQDKHSRNALSVLNSMDGNLNFFQILHRHGCYNWKATQKYPFLKAFAWLYQLCRYIRKALRGKHFISKFFGARKIKKKNMDLLEELEVQRRNRTIDYE